VSQELHFKPHARLLTMLGDQLIKNERVALVEIIKNSYDADASWVKVTFQDFGESYKVGPNPKIIIEDDGMGMTRDVLENHWISPATPVKKQAKGQCLPSR
jgi:HSP90 family molecular chaperone